MAAPVSLRSARTVRKGSGSHPSVTKEILADGEGLAAPVSLALGSNRLKWIGFESLEIEKLADGEGFEPSEPLWGSHAFQASPFDHSGTHPSKKRAIEIDRKLNLLQEKTLHSRHFDF